MKNGWYQKHVFNRISKISLKYFPHYEIKVTAKYLPSSRNVEAHLQSREAKVNAECRLIPQYFREFVRWNHWNATNLVQSVPLCIPTFSPINKVIIMLVKNKVQKILNVASSWQLQVSYPTILRMSLRKSLLLPHHLHLLLSHQGQIHPLIANKTI